MKRFPLAWFITFHPYGLWLPGDRRGWTDRRMVRRGIIRMPPMPGLEAHARSLMREPPLRLDAPMRAVVRAAIVELISHRGWRLDALSVQHDHLHVVCGAESVGTSVRGAMKAWGTRRLRESGLVTPNRTVWADGGSIRYVFSLAGIERVVAYVRDQ